MLTGRLLQGFSAGAEPGGVSIYLAEIAPRDERASTPAASLPAGGDRGGRRPGFALKALLDDGALRAWDWRIPFFVGCLIVPFIFALRRRLKESDAFAHRRAHPGLRRVCSTLLGQRRIVAAGMLMVVMTTTAFDLITVCAPTVGKRVLLLSASDSLLVTLLAAVSSFCWLPVGGALSDRVGRKPLLIILSLTARLTTWPALSLLAAAPGFGMMLAVLLWLSMIYGLYNGAMTPALTEVRPVQVRGAGFSLAYSLTTALFGGVDRADRLERR
ncbi:MFS transporter [Pantoea sp. 1.19]|uniref:MFS transporter n=1 Tax=Pantoea sp. 1.19 TaxID=1925589 RepID=UPI001F0B0CB2|nr:MFS transporter [Pantoea sp. 1.19]